MGEATATVQRVSRKRHQEAHTGSLVLQAAATGAPLDLLSGSLRLQLPAGRGVSEGTAHWRSRFPDSKLGQILPSHLSSGPRWKFNTLAPASACTNDKIAIVTRLVHASCSLNSVLNTLLFRCESFCSGK